MPRAPSTGRFPAAEVRTMLAAMRTTASIGTVLALLALAGCSERATLPGFDAGRDAGSTGVDAPGAADATEPADAIATADAPTGADATTPTDAAVAVDARMRDSGGGGGGDACTPR